MSDSDSFFLVQVLVGVVCVPPSFRCVHEKAITCVWPNTLLSDSKLEKLVILRMDRDSMVHMRKHYRHLIKNTPSHGAVWNEHKWKIPSEASMRTQCMGRHVQGQPRWQQTTCAAPHVYTRDTLLGSRPFSVCLRHVDVGFRS